MDDDLRAGIEKVTENDLLDENYDGVPNAVVLLFREEDGDLADALLDAAKSLDEYGTIWLMVPKAGKNGHVKPWTSGDAATSAGGPRRVSSTPPRTSGWPPRRRTRSAACSR
ncbi:DUF3052 family protein [Streptomyces sp. NPDC050619]|uniref:DUF3052 family protein n=1 Tax=Streptomyces sp. NPDC050619 TaxID=3157214 RepID=UPI0034495AB8